MFHLPNTFVQHFVVIFLAFFKQYKTSATRHIICDYGKDCLNVAHFKTCYRLLRVNT